MPQPSSTFRVQLPVPARVVVLVSGSGTLLQALLDATADPGYPAQVVAVGADRAGIEGLARAERAGVPTFVEPVRAYPDRTAWNAAIAATVVAHRPDLVVSAGFMKILGVPEGDRLPDDQHSSGAAARLSGRAPRCRHARLRRQDHRRDRPPRRRRRGDGPVLAQAAVEVWPGDTVGDLHERIKIEERRLLVGTVAALARNGASVSGREVTIPWVNRRRRATSGGRCAGRW